MKIRNIFYFLLSLFLFCSLNNVSAQETGTQVGIGVSLEPTRLFVVGSTILSNATTPVNVYVPINIGSNFRLEPELGFFSYATKTTSGSTTSKSDASVTRIGIGGFYRIMTNNVMRMYVGPRIGFYFVSSKSSYSSDQFGSYSNETKETDFTLGLSLGGEYFAAPQFSVGGEAQINYINFGNPDKTPTPTPSTRTQNIFTSNALLFLRFYF